MNLVEIVNDFSTAKDNWNDYGAKPFSKKVIARALAVANLLEGTGFKVFPTPCDSILFEKEKEESYLQIEIFEDKDECYIKVKD